MIKRIKKYFKPIPRWYPTFEDKNINNQEYTYNAITQRPPHMYHSWDHIMLG